MLARDGDQLAPSQRSGIAEQQQGAVADAGEAAVAAGDEAADLSGGQRRDLAGRRAVPAQDTTQGVTDGWVAGVPEMVAGEGMRPAMAARLRRALRPCAEAKAVR
jgi:hypothetical protein